MKTYQWMNLSHKESTLRNEVLANHIAAFLCKVNRHTMNVTEFHKLYNSLPNDKLKARFLAMIDQAVNV